MTTITTTNSATPDTTRYPINAPCGYISPVSYVGIVLLYLLGIALIAVGGAAPVVLAARFAVESTTILLGSLVLTHLAGFSAVYGALHLWGGSRPRPVAVLIVMLPWVFVAAIAMIAMDLQ